MNIEEKQAIEMMKFYQEEYRKQIKTLKGNGEPEGYGTIIDTIKGRICNIQLVLNLIEKQQAELEKKDEYIKILTDEREHIKNNLKVDLNKKGVFSQAKGQIAQILEYYENNEKYFNKVEREGK